MMRRATRFIWNLIQSNDNRVRSGPARISHALTRSGSSNGREPDCHTNQETGDKQMRARMIKRRAGGFRRKKTQRAVTRKVRVNRLTGSYTRIKAVKYIRKAVILCAGLAGAGMLFAGSQAKAAGQEGQFHSRGAIHYTDAAGQEVILDTQDLQVLFQYAAEGKGGLSQALGGVGTKLIGDGQNYQYTKNPEAEATVERLQTEEELQAVNFDLLLQALSESQTLPAGYEDSYTLACADNMTLGRAAWSDGSLARGNNKDLIEHYMRGWLEGSGCTNYEAVYDEEGRWIGYREKES